MRCPAAPRPLFGPISRSPAAAVPGCGGEPASLAKGTEAARRAAKSSDVIGHFGARGGSFPVKIVTDRRQNLPDCGRPHERSVPEFSSPWLDWLKKLEFAIPEWPPFKGL